MIDCIFATLHDYLIEGQIFFISKTLDFFNQVIRQSNRFIERFFFYWFKHIIHLYFKTRIWLFREHLSSATTKLNLFNISSAMRIDALFTAIKSPQNKFTMILFYSYIMIY